LNAKSGEERVVYKKLNSTETVDSENNHGGSAAARLFGKSPMSRYV
jgi:hypothetical protein